MAVRLKVAPRAGEGGRGADRGHSRLPLAALAMRLLGGV